MLRVLQCLLLVFAAAISPVLHAVNTEQQPSAAALDPDYAAGKKAIADYREKPRAGAR